MKNQGFNDFYNILKHLPSNLQQAATSRIEFEQLPEERKSLCFKIADFLNRYQELQQAKEKQQLTDEDNQLLDSVEKILNDCLDMLKEIKGE